MEVNCEGCAGCCLDWRPLSEESLDHERRGSRRPLDDTYNHVPLTRDEVDAFLESGLGDVLVPRLWRAESPGETVTVDGVDVVGIDGRPVFFVGLRKVPKPVAPFGAGATWLDTCTFLDPETLQCRIHGGDLYPGECGDYPGHNLALDRETECERVERVHGGERLLDDAPPEGTGGLLLGPHAVGAKVFVHPDPARLDGVVERAEAGALTAADRAEFAAVAAASHPGSTEVDEERYVRAREAALAADSWGGAVGDRWADVADERGTAAGVDPADASAAEKREGAPETPGW
ncbi:MAG: YkgJ family cysteine cluster protein [Haloferacaceae archaeon]